MNTATVGITPQRPAENTWQEVRMKQLQEFSKPTFSREFVEKVGEKLIDILSERLRKRGDTFSLKILDLIVILVISFQQSTRDGKLSGLNDENVISALGEISYALNLFEQSDS